MTTFYSIQNKRLIYHDDFIQQWSGNYQSHNSGSANRIWNSAPGRDGVLQLQANNGYNSLRPNPNSLYVDSRKLVLEADVAIIRNSGNQVYYFGLMDKHLGELPILNGVYLQGTTDDGMWRAFSYRSGVLIDSAVVGSLATNNTFQAVNIEIGIGVALVSVDGVETEIDLSNGFAAGLCFGLSNTGVSWPSLLLDWVKMSR